MIDKNLSFFQNKAVINVNQNSTDNRQVFNQQGKVAWIAKVDGSQDRFLALFNTNDKKESVKFELELEYLRGRYQFTNLWTGKNLGEFKGEFETELNAHGAGLYKLKKVKA